MMQQKYLIKYQCNNKYISLDFYRIELEKKKKEKLRNK